MPKKTKKEKIIAEYRRKLLDMSDKGISSPTVNDPGPVVSRSSPISTFSIPHTPPTNHHTDAITLDPKEFMAIKKDLIKTLILTCCIIVGQLAIWKIVG